MCESLAQKFGFLKDHLIKGVIAMPLPKDRRKKITGDRKGGEEAAIARPGLDLGKRR